MYWTKKIGTALGIRTPPQSFDNFQGPEAEERVRTTLSQNTAVGGVESIADELIAEGKIVNFLKGDEIITQGEQDDDVFFLLAGETDIIAAGRKIAVRSAPNQVGEMAVIEPGTPRSATVKARSKTLTALVVPGAIFRRIWSNNSKFMERLQIEMLTRHRDRIDGTTFSNDRKAITWIIVSVAVALICWGATWIATSSSGWAITSRFATSTVSATLAFVLVMLNNPALVYLFCFRLFAFGLFGTVVVDVFVSFDINFDAENIGFEFVSDCIENDFTHTLIGAIAFLGAMLICATMDKSIAHR